MKNKSIIAFIILLFLVLVFSIKDPRMKFKYKPLQSIILAKEGVVLQYQERSNFLRSKYRIKGTNDSADHGIYINFDGEVTIITANDELIVKKIKVQKLNSLINKLNDMGTFAITRKSIREHRSQAILWGDGAFNMHGKNAYIKLSLVDTSVKVEVPNLMQQSNSYPSVQEFQVLKNAIQEIQKSVGYYF